MGGWWWQLEGAAEVAVQLCILTGRPAVLWEHVFPRFQAYDQVPALLARLQPHILAGDLPSPAPEVVQVSFPCHSHPVLCRIPPYHHDHVPNNVSSKLWNLYDEHGKRNLFSDHSEIKTGSCVKLRMMKDGTLRLALCVAGRM